jgi:hypothetical protein
VGDTYITRSYVNYIPRYFMLSFTYKIANYKGVASKSSSQSSGERRGGMGGPGGGGMPPM